MRKYSSPTFELVKLLQKWQPDAEIAGGAGAGVHAFNPGSASPGHLPRGSQFIYMDVTNGNDQEVPIVEAIRDFTRDPNLELV